MKSIEPSREVDSTVFVFPVEEPETQRTEVSWEVTQLLRGGPSPGPSPWWLSAHLCHKDQLHVLPGASPSRLLPTVPPRPPPAHQGSRALSRACGLGETACEVEPGRPGQNPFAVRPENTCWWCMWLHLPPNNSRITVLTLPQSLS